MEKGVVGEYAGSAAPVAETREVIVDLGGFAFDALGGAGVPPTLMASRLWRAVLTYWADRETGRPGWVYPALIQEREPSATVRIELLLDGSVLSGLVGEARQRGVTLTQLVGHAALYYLAELDAGRMKQSILDELASGSAQD